METAIGGAIVGAIVAVAAPSIICGIGQVLRPVAKGIIKGGVVTFNAVSEMVSETGEQFNDLVAEASRALADHVIALLTHFPEGEEVAVILGGGLIGSDTAVRRRTLTELGTRAPQARVLDAEVDPAAGALRMAAKRFLRLK